jgi:biotin transport system ATP-binding protein
MLIEFDDVYVKRGSVTVLQEVNLSLAEHRIGIIGVNGAGKSTLARLINGLVVPSSGTVKLDGQDIQRDLKRVRQRVAFVFQNPDNQIVFPMVREDMAFGLKPLLPDSVARDQRIENTLVRLGIASLIDRTIAQLSGGQKQLISLAGALCREPELLVLDEPTAHLDLRYRNRLIDLLQRAPEQAIVLTHDLAMLQNFDRVLVIDDGQVVCDDVPSKALTTYINRCQS